MCTGRNLIARVACARLSYAENLVSGDLLGACGVRMRSGRSCVRGAQVQRGCAAGVWVAACMRGGGAWHRWWAANVGRVPLPATRTRVLVARADTWGAGRRCVSLQCGVGHASVFGLVRRPVALSGLSRWSPSGTYRGCCMSGGYSVERFLTMRTLRISRSSAHLQVSIDPARSPMPRNQLLPAPTERLCASLLDVCRALHTKHALVVKT
jgi:hypothetical protein